jgi:hypothetical protein
MVIAIKAVWVSADHLKTPMLFGYLMAVERFMLCAIH